MNIMTKRGSLDNVVTYEHICDTTADMNNINPNYITLGSTCIVLSGDDSGEMEVYIANSKKEWKPIAAGMISGGSNSVSGSGNSLVVNSTGNYDDGYYLDQTANKISMAFIDGTPVIIKRVVIDDETGETVEINSLVDGYQIHNGVIMFVTPAGGDITTYVANSFNEYPRGQDTTVINPGTITPVGPGGTM